MAGSPNKMSGKQSLEWLKMSPITNSKDFEKRFARIELY